MGLLTLWIPSDHVYHPNSYLFFSVVSSIVWPPVFTVIVKRFFSPAQLKNRMEGVNFTEIPGGGFALTKYTLLLLPTFVTVLVTVTVPFSFGIASDG